MNIIPNKSIILAALVGSLALTAGKKQEVVDVLDSVGGGRSLVLQTVLSPAPQAEALYKKILLGASTVAPDPIVGIHLVTSFDSNNHIQEEGRLILESDGNYYLGTGNERMFLTHQQAQEIIKKGKIF